MLKVHDLNIYFDSQRSRVHAVRNVSFDLGQERLGIVGESGSGKSQTCRAILGLAPSNATVEAAQLSFDGQDLRALTPAAWRRIRGQRISMVMQDPKYSLNPVMTVGEQIVEACRQHRYQGQWLSRRAARRRALAMLEQVRIREPERVFGQYPHQLSGGMGQRVMIAMMLVPDPELIIADEPTSALDVTVQLQVLAVLDDLVRERGMALIFISHDLTLVSSFCDRVLVMYQGRVVEELPANALDTARHPYTQGLIACLPTEHTRGRPLPTLQRDPAWLQ